jgi:5'(3')-deoxyribonucleotidase
MKKPTIYFDMDGTIADLYGIPNWLDRIHASDPSPYAEAQPLVDIEQLITYINRTKEMGFCIGIISWLPKDSTFEYDRLVENAKREWLEKNLPSVSFDEIHIVEYGISKNLYCGSAGDILWDDENENRKEWGGLAFGPDTLKLVLKQYYEN